MKNTTFALLTCIFSLSFLLSCDKPLPNEVSTIEDEPLVEKQVPSTKSSLSELSSSEKLVLEIYKDPNCGCCTKWVDHLDENDFETTTVMTNDLDRIKLDKKIPAKYQSCHTGISKEGYFFEGHVPAKFVKKFLKEKPVGALGLTVPAMPVGTPGMEVGNKFMPYKIFMLMEKGDATVYADIKTKEQQY